MFMTTQLIFLFGVLTKTKMLRQKFSKFFSDHIKSSHLHTSSAKCSPIRTTFQYDHNGDDQHHQQQQQQQDGPDQFRMEPMYETHIRLTPVQRVLLSIGSGLVALEDPYRDDAVATFGETTGLCALKKIHEEMLNHREGFQILKDQPRINSKTIDLDRLAELPPNTFGFTYYHFLRDNKITPDSRRDVRFVDDPELAYVCQRYREVHDLVHCILSMPTNMLGEVIVKWVEAIQTDLPMCWLGGLFGAIKLNAKARKVYTEIGLPWALRCGHQAEKFMCVYFEKRFEQDFEELRTELKIPTPPIIGRIRSHV